MIYIRSYNCEPIVPIFWVYTVQKLHTHAAINATQMHVHDIIIIWTLSLLLLLPSRRRRSVDFSINVSLASRIRIRIYIWICSAISTQFASHSVSFQSLLLLLSHLHAMRARVRQTAYYGIWWRCNFLCVYVFCCCCWWFCYCTLT